MKHEFGLAQADVKKILSVFEQCEAIEEVVLYGSRAKGNYHPGSDVDLTLKGVELNLKSLNKISNELDDLLLPYYFDLSIFTQIENEELIDHIQRVGVTIYQT
ncbi:MAG: nucleotidyltransferase domain-containing protein [Anaerolineaceae bacterium]|nr:nucleotidyltransferase domain-containing protein [Anaerolineaceae bacterium]